MSLSTLAAVKAELGIATADTSQDTKLTGFLRTANRIIRNRIGRYIGGLISANTLANPTVVTSIGHGLVTGDVIVIGGSNSTPTIDGSQTVTRISDDTFSVPVNVTVAGTQGYYARTFTDYLCGSGFSVQELKEYPVLSLSSVYLDDAGYFGDGDSAFAADTLLTVGQDFALDKSRGYLVKIGGIWPNVNQRLQGMLSSGVSDGIGNIKVTYTPGYPEGVPYDLQEAAIRLVTELDNTAGSGSGMSAESLDYYSYQKAPAAEQAKMLSSVAGILAQYRRIVV